MSTKAGFWLSDLFVSPKSMGSGTRNEGSASSSPWSVFDAVKSFPSTPEALMAEIDAAIAASEYAHATAVLEDTAAAPPRYDSRLADEAYKAGCAALTAGKKEEALRSLRISLSHCPPNKINAISKLKSLISIASQTLQEKP